MGYGIMHGKSSKQKINVKSSTESELVRMGEYVPYNTLFFIAYPCAPTNIINHILYGTYLPIPTNSDSVEIFTFIFCFEDFPCIIPA